MAVNVVQTSFRVRTDATAAQGGVPVWGAAQNVNAIVQAGNKFRVRFAISDIGTTNFSLTPIALYYSKNGAPYALLANGSDVFYADATNGLSADGSAIVTSFLTGTGTFSNGSYSSINGNDYASLPHGSYTEYEFGLSFASPACDGNAYTFRVYLAGGPLTSYTVTPSFVMTNNAALRATEAGDTITAAGNVPRAALLNMLEVADALTGSGTVLWPTGVLAITEDDDVLTGVALAIPATASLAITEADDILNGMAFEIPVGGLWAHLAIVEGGDALAGLGTGSGDVGSLNVQEDDDALAGAAGVLVEGVLNAVEDDDTVASHVLLWADQWIPATGCGNEPWIQIVSPSEPIIIPPPIIPPTPITPPGTGEMLIMEQLNVVGVNALSNLSHPPNMDLCQLTVDGRPFFPIGASPDFSVSGNSVTWLSTDYSVVPGSTVIASYSWTP